MGKKLVFAFVLLALVAAPTGYLLRSWRRAGQLSVVAGGRLSTVDMTAMSVSPDGRYVAAGDGERFAGLTDAFGRRLWRYALTLNGERPVEAVAVSAGGRRVAAATGDGRVYVFDVHAKPLWRVDLGRRVTSVALSGDGRTTAVASDGVVQVFDGRVPAWRRAVPRAAFTRLLVAGGGRRVIGVSRGHLLAIDPSGSRIWRELPGRVLDAAPDPASGGVFALTARRVMLLDRDGRLRRIYRPQIGRLVGLAVAAHGRHFSLVTADNDVLLVDRENKAPVFYPRVARAPVTGLFLTRGTQLLVFASGDGLQALDLGRSLSAMRRVARQARFTAAVTLLAGLALAIGFTVFGRRPPAKIELPPEPVQWREAA